MRPPYVYLYTKYCLEPNASASHSKGSFTHEVMEVKMMNGRHLDMRNIFSFLDDTFSMNISQLKERLIPVENLEPHWF